MGLSTVAIGLLPTYASIGCSPPPLLALCRFGQGIGLGGEWGGAVLLAIENAPPGKRAWYGMFPQLGAPIGFRLPDRSVRGAHGILERRQLNAWGWRLPFLASALLVLVGLYVRLKITETPAFQRAMEKQRARASSDSRRAARATTRSWLDDGRCRRDVRDLLLDDGVHAELGYDALGFGAPGVPALQIVGVLFFAATVPLSAKIAERNGRPPMLIDRDARHHRRSACCSGRCSARGSAFDGRFSCRSGSP